MKESAGCLNINFIKSCYIKRYKIDRTKNSVRIYYLNGKSEEIPYTKSNLNNIKSDMYYQYDNWSKNLAVVFFFNLIKQAKLNNMVKKQNFYMKNEHYLSDLRMNNANIHKYLSKNELFIIEKSKQETDSYFNLSSVNNYSISTLKKVKNAIINEQKIKSKRKTKHK